MTQLVLLRHGESISNRDGYFTGWNDVALSQRGEHQAEQAGRLLKETGCEFDYALLRNLGEPLIHRVSCYRQWGLTE